MVMDIMTHRADYLGSQLNIESHTTVHVYHAFFNGRLKITGDKQTNSSESHLLTAPEMKLFSTKFRCTITSSDESKWSLVSIKRQKNLYQHIPFD